MKLTSEILDDMLIVHVDEARIDAAGAIQFKESMRAATADAAAPARVVLNLARVGFLDSSGLGAVVAVMKLLMPARKLELACLTPTVEKVFRLTRMDSVFRIHATVPGALRDAS
ncbi:MAG: STAS domain-containing protein [Rhodobacteraceae bacterium]|jgi:anti-sigma B factor antagonist|nr:STAS domain-containing protein [Paracoccaceae bacterium]